VTELKETTNDKEIYSSYSRYHCANHTENDMHGENAASSPFCMHYIKLTTQN